MPRTIWLKECASDENKSEKELRDDAEQSHWYNLHRTFVWQQQAIIRSQLEQQETGKSEYAFALSVPHGDRTVELADLPNKTIRAFCFKDCAVYCTADASASVTWNLDLYARIYRRWFPSRAEDTDISHGNFFCSLVNCPKPDSVYMSAFITQLVGFHTALCGQMRKKIPTVPPAFPLWISSIPSTRHLETPSTDYRLRPTFEKCFLIVHAANHSRVHAPRDTIIEEPGAFIVWLQRNEVPRLTSGMTETSLDLDGIVAYQCDSVDTAMQFVLSTDPSRSVRRREWHGHYQEVLDQNDEMYGSVCQCTFCR